MKKFLRKKKDLTVWQDREIQFDLPKNMLDLRRGEFVIDTLHSIEDTKGNNGEQGVMTITNLRIIWVCKRNKRLNLSIGLNCVSGLKTQGTQSKNRGHTQSLFILTRFKKQSFEFVFTNLVKNSPRLFSSVQGVFKAYESTKLYRDLKLRAALIRDGEVNLLPKEQKVNVLKGVWNLSSDQGNLGTFVVTNIRCVWFSELAENFNVSIPFLQIKSVRIRNSKFGVAFVIETSELSGHYILGFRIDPESKLQYLHKEVTSLHKLYANNPIFGIDKNIENHVQKRGAPPPRKLPEAPKHVGEGAVGEGAAVSPEKKKVMNDYGGTQTGVESANDSGMKELGKEEVEILNLTRVKDPLVAYYADGKNKKTDRKIVFNQELGLAIEELIEGVESVGDLWKCSVK